MDKDRLLDLTEVTVSGTSIPNQKPSRKHKGKEKEKFGEMKLPINQDQQPKSQLRGQAHNSLDVRISKTISWLLRHGAQSQGLIIRTDGYVKVDDLLQNPKLKTHDLTLKTLKEIVRLDSKQRYDLILEDSKGPKVATDLSTISSDTIDGVWWIKARQGHSIKTIQVELKPVASIEDIPSRTAVHGTNLQAWLSICTQGLSKMKRNHIHLAQGVAGENVISGMRTASQIFIFINVQKALDAGIEFFLSDNGVILTEGDDRGFLGPEFFERVEDSKGQVVVQGSKNG